MFLLNLNTNSIKKFIRTYAKDDNWHNLDIETGNLGYGLIHYSLIRTLKPDRILCIGSRYGFIPAICALACKDNRYGMVDFVDAGFDQNANDPHHWGGVGLWKQIDPYSYFKPFGLNKYIDLHVTTSSKYATSTRHHWQYVHLDGDHSYQGVKTDFDLFWPRLTLNGHMCFHDIYTRDLGPEVYGVNRFWKKIQKQYPGIELPGQFGLGIIQKNE